MNNKQPCFKKGDEVILTELGKKYLSDIINTWSMEGDNHFSDMFSNKYLNGIFTIEAIDGNWIDVIDPDFDTISLLKHHIQFI